MLNLSEGICSELVFFLCIFESQYSDTGLEITEVIEQLLKFYENLTERYRACLYCLEEKSKDNSFQCEQELARSQGRPRFLISKSQSNELKDLSFAWSKIAMIGVSCTTLYRCHVELGLEEDIRF